MAATVFPSLLDRMLEEPISRDLPSARQKYREALTRDLEALLNARLSWHTWPDEYEELNKSLFSYGLPDFSSMTLSTKDGRFALCKIIEQTIRRFEPRFYDVKVSSMEEDEPIDRILRIRVHALCYGDPDPEEIIFDSEIEPVCLAVKVVSE